MRVTLLQYLHISRDVLRLPDTFRGTKSTMSRMDLPANIDDPKELLLLGLMLFAAAGAKLFSLSNCGPNVAVRLAIIKLGLGAEAVTREAFNAAALQNLLMLSTHVMQSRCKVGEKLKLISCCARLRYRNQPGAGCNSRTVLLLLLLVLHVSVNGDDTVAVVAAAASVDAGVIVFATGLLANSGPSIILLLFNYSLRARAVKNGNSLVIT